MSFANPSKATERIGTRIVLVIFLFSFFAVPLFAQSSPKLSAPKTSKGASKGKVLNNPQATLPMVAPESVGMSGERLTRIDDAIREAIAHHDAPGAVVLVARHGKIVYRKAYGNRSVEPKIQPMETSTVFDMASVTKVVATATSLMILLERGAYRLDEPISKYLTEFAAPPKETVSKPVSTTPAESPAPPGWDPRDKSKVTIRQLMTHFSGLRPDFNLAEKWSGYEEAIRRLKDETLQSPPGEKFIYSDLNYIALGELVHKLSGQPLDVFARNQILEPLRMKDSEFNLDAAHRARAAPTERRAATEAYLGGKESANPTDAIIQGEVHDPTAWRMGGVAGHAGLFSTADDMAIFCQMILNRGVFAGRRILGPLGVKTMTSNQAPSSSSAVRVERGIGWDMASSYSSNRGDLFPIGSIGHTGFTGTDIWIDPTTDTFLVLLTNRVHPNGKGNVTALRSKVATIVAASILDLK